jgi:hypothetical protein
MTFAGWSLAQLLPVIGAAAGGVTLLYLLKMRRRQLEVPFAALWERVLRETETRKLWRRLRRVLSWLIQLLLLGLVAFALRDPRPSAWLRDPQTLALVVDVSASMAGASDEPDGGEAADEGDGADEGDASPPRLERVLERARAEVEALGPADRAMLIVAGPEVEVPGPLTRNPSRLLDAFDRIEVVAGEADLEGALALAHNALGGQPGARIMVLTDGALSDASVEAIDDCPREAVQCLVHHVSGPTANVAITAFAARRYPSDHEKVEVLAEVLNLGEEPARVRLRVEADGLDIGTVELDLAPGARERQIIPGLDAARDRLVARLEPIRGDKDGRRRLGPALDDIAWAVVPPLEPLQVTLVTDGTNLFLEAALLTLDDHVRLTFVSPAEASATHEDIVDADLVIFDAPAHALPRPLPERNLVIFDPHRFEGSPAPIAAAGTVKRPRITEQARKHPMLQGVVFKDVNMHQATTFALEPGDVALVGHLGAPIVAAREREHVLVQIGFDPRASDLPLRVAFPLLVANTVDYVARRDAGFVASIPIGASREISLANLGLANLEIPAVEVIAPDQTTTRVPVSDGRFRMRATIPGVHRVRVLGGEADGSEVELAVNQVNAAASSLSSRLDALPPERSSGEAPDPTPLEEGPLWTLILLIALGLVAGEWATYHRRRTV